MMSKNYLQYVFNQFTQLTCVSKSEMPMFQVHAATVDKRMHFYI